LREETLEEELLEVKAGGEGHVAAFGELGGAILFLFPNQGKFTTLVLYFPFF
jgi:hypothetical protein